MGSYLSNNMISELTLDFVVLPVLDAVTHVVSWLYSVVEVVDKCLDSMPRGPAGSSHGDFAEVEFSVNTSETTSADSQQQQQGLGAKIRNSLKLVEMESIGNRSGRASRIDHGDGNGKKGNNNSTGEHHVCAVCLADVREEEKVYELPQCNHIFHSVCLDKWVGHNHYTCPLCRTSLLLTDSSSCNSGAITIRQNNGEVVEVDDSGFSLGIWFVSRCAMNANFYGTSWTRAMMRLAGF